MRALKFRAWDKRDKRMAVPEHLSLVLYLDGTPVVYSQEDGGKDGLWEHELTEYAGRFEVMQYTCLRDQDGREIYEGDIVEERVEGMGTGRVFLVRWDDEDLTYKVGAAMLGGEDVKVIGTVQENPDLLKSTGTTEDK